jgi:predicted metal-binding membrane protein
MEQTSQWKRWTWRHPEWWSMGLSLLAWLSFLGRGDGAASSEFNPFYLHHHAHVEGLLFPWTTEMIAWMIMVVAMMLPLIVDRMRITAMRSMWERRHRSIFLFTLGYLAVWMLAGIVAGGAIVSLETQTWFRPAIVSAISFSLAAFWQFTATKRRALISCHRTIPLAPHGWRANADCLHYGWLIGGSCLANCGVLMVACSLSGHSLAAMVGAGSIIAVERYGVRPSPVIFAAAIAGLGLICAFLYPHQ